MKYEVCVLIPHYNNPDGLIRSLSSIQSNYRTGILIADDGSLAIKKPDIKTIKGLPNLKDAEVFFLDRAKNLGIEYTLNEGLEFILNRIGPEYILRLDTGDLCVNDRIDKQKSFLDDNPSIDLIGSDVRYVDEEGNSLFDIRFPTEHHELKRHMLVSVSFIHSAVMFRTSALNQVGRYTTDYPAAEDYAFFYKFVTLCQTASLPEILTLVEWSSSGISVLRRKEQLISRLKLTWKYRSVDPKFIYGMCRLLVLIITPYKLIETIKKVLYR